MAAGNTFAFAMATEVAMVRLVGSLVHRSLEAQGSDMAHEDGCKHLSSILLGSHALSQLIPM